MKEKIKDFMGGAWNASKSQARIRALSDERDYMRQGWADCSDERDALQIKLNAMAEFADCMWNLHSNLNKELESLKSAKADAPRDADPAQSKPNL